MALKHRIVASMCSAVLLGACQDSPPVPTALTRVDPHLQAAAAADSTTPPQGPYVAVDLGTLGGQSGEALDINKTDDIVGFAQDSTGASHAFLWENGVMLDLGTLGGKSSRASAINDQGDIAGVSDATDGSLHAVRWEKGVIQDLGAISGNTVLLNQRGDVAWNATASGANSTHAFLWTNGAAQDLGTLGGATSSARGLNDHGDVTGLSSTAGGSTDVFLWSNGRMQDIPASAPGIGLQSVGVNNHDWIAGTLTQGKGDSTVIRAWIWEGDSIILIPLANINDKFSIAVGITQHGAVFGNGLDLNFDEPLPFAWSRGAFMGPTGVAGFKTLNDMNEQGVGIGIEDVRSGDSFHAVVFDNGVAWDMGTLVPSGDVNDLSEGLAINAGGDAVGWSFTPPGTHPVLWRRVH